MPSSTVYGLHIPVDADTGVSAFEDVTNPNLLDAAAGHVWHLNAGTPIEEVWITTNAVLVSGVWQYKATAQASAMQKKTADGSTTFYVAPTGTAGNTITWQTLLSLTAVASMVNYLQLTGAAAGNRPIIQALGTDSNIDISLVPKGTGAVGGTGTTQLPVYGIVPPTDVSQKIGGPSLGFLQVYLRGTTGVVRYDDTTIMGNTEKVGSGGGDYTTNSTSFVDVDSTNLALTLTIPTGWKLLVIGSGTFFPSTSNNAAVGIYDSVANNMRGIQNSGLSSTYIPFCVTRTILGDGSSHTVKLRFAIQTAGTATIANGADGNIVDAPPHMQFILMPSN